MSTRIKLLESFDGAAGQVVSGEVLARRLGVSRTAVWKQMQSLKNSGLPVESTGRLGYRLNAPLDSSLARFRAWPGIVPHYSLSTSSTQTLAKAGAASGLPEGHLWMAETQTKGRGRLDRLWESNYGGLWFSLLVRPKMPAARVPPLTLIAGMCLRDAVEKVSGVRSKLKWPNDLVIPSPPAALVPLPRGEGGRRRDPGEGGFKKLAGILTEMSGQIDRTDWVVIGVGLNVNNKVSRDLSAKTASIYELTGSVSERSKILQLFLRFFQPAYARFQKEGFEPFREEYWSHYFAPKLNVRLKTASGILAGFARGVDASGAIMIESRRKMSAISEGEIIL